MTKAIAARNAKTVLRSSIHKHRVRVYHDIFHFSDSTVIQYHQDHPSQYEKRQPIVAQWVIVTDFGPCPSGQTTNQPIITTTRTRYFLLKEQKGQRGQ